MGVPKEIREVPRPVNTVVTDNGRNTPLRYSVRERASSGKYVPGKNPKPKNGRVIGHIIGFKYVPLDAAETGNASGSRRSLKRRRRVRRKAVRPVPFLKKRLLYLTVS